MDIQSALLEIDGLVSSENYKNEPAPKSLILPQRHKASKFHKEYVVVNLYFVKLRVLVA